MIKKKTSKKVVCLLITLMFLVTLVGCSNNENSDSQKPDLAQELVIGENVDLAGYDPVKDMSPFVRFLIFDSLIELGYNYEKIPALATTWEMSPDGKTWTFNLRKDVKFHDGQAWDSKAAQINFQHRIEAGASGFYADIESMETPDEHTFVVHLNKPIFTFSSDIAVPTHGMVSPKAFDENHEVTAAIGTGPFKLESWTKDVEFIMTANEDFYEGEPILQKLTFKVILDGDTRALALQNGEIDLMSGRNALTSLESLKNQEDIQVIKTLGQTSEIVMVNTFDELLSNLEIRKAIAASVDFATAVPQLLTDLAEAPQSFFSPVFGEFVNTELKLPEYNPEEARENLIKAGYTLSADDNYYYKDNEKLSLNCLVDSKNEEDKALVTVMKEQLRENGIHLDITMLDSAAIKEQVSNHDYQLAMQGQNYVPTDDPSFHYAKGYYHSDSFFNSYSTPELDAKIDKLFNSLDKEERITLHKELQEEITEQVPVIMMFHRNNIILANKKLTDYEMAKGTWQIYKGLEKAQING